MTRGSRILCLTILIAVPTAFMAPSTFSQTPELHVIVHDSTVGDCNSDHIITVFMDNLVSEVAEFDIRLNLDQPGIVAYDAQYHAIEDTSIWICIDHGDSPCDDSVRVSREYCYWHPVCYSHVYTADSVANLIDTVGSLIAGWELVDVRSYRADHTDLRIVAISDLDPDDGTYIPGIPAGQQGGVLFQLEATIASVVDPVEQCASLLIPTDPFYDFSFSNPSGYQIGLAYSPDYDTNYFVCEQWDPIDPEVCLKWIKVPEPPYDSIEIVPDSIPYVDTVYLDSAGHVQGSVWIQHGILCACISTCCSWYTTTCGNTDCSEDGKVTLSDIACLIDRLYISGTECCCMEAANCGPGDDDKITLSDLTTLIDHVYISKSPLPDCPCM